MVREWESGLVYRGMSGMSYDEIQRSYLQRITVELRELTVKDV